MEEKRLTLKLNKPHRHSPIEPEIEPTFPQYQQIPPPIPVYVQAYPVYQQNVWRCPFCQSNAGYEFISRTSSIGWALFVVMLLFLCLPLCWIGLLIKDDFQRCRNCFIRLG